MASKALHVGIEAAVEGPEVSQKARDPEPLLPLGFGDGIAHGEKAWEKAWDSDVMDIMDYMDDMDKDIKDLASLLSI